MTKMLKILVVDNDGPLARGMEQLISGILGDTVLIAMDDAAAHACLKENPDVQVILMDGMLDYGESVGLIREIRKNGYKGDMTTFTGAVGDLTRRMLEAGCDRSLRKPAGLEDIRLHLDKIRNATSE